MQSVNFEFLRGARPELAMFAGFAEHYAHTDPTGSLSKLRSFAEQVVDGIYATYCLPKPWQPNLNDLLNESAFRSQVPGAIQAKLHALRLHGNKAVHANQGNTLTALAMLREAWDIARWLFAAFHAGKPGLLPNYSEPQAPQDARKLEADRQRLAAKLAEQEQQMQALLADLAEAKSKQPESVPSAEALQLTIQAGQNAADALAFDEATTRSRLVDAMLVAAGWKVGGNGQNTEEVGQEIEIPQPQNPSGIGYIDYVLWNDDGKPLGLIETKRTAKSAQAGRTQAELYADAAEAKYGQRPVIFYSNGFDLFIWDDAQGQTPRRLFGFYSKDSLQYLHFQRHHKLPLDQVAAKPEIAGRMYQLETLRRVTERFTGGYRKALIVLATGTGKTRVAVSLSELLIRARWAKHILFLSDRRELRKQADNVFKEHLPGEPRILISSHTAGDVTPRIYLATYPAMMQCFEQFDPGFFDLIIADESHRSIYNRYRDLFVWFDALQVGLTATPVQFIARNTYGLFDCENGDPTAYFSYQDAISHVPPYLVPFEVYTHTTEFLRQGIKYKELSTEQRAQLEEDQADAEAFDFEVEEVDRVILNKDTNRAILRNLMENGIREATGAHIGKTILFARNHTHAMLLAEVFDELYPQYGGQFCRVIDTYDVRAEQLIDDFKEPSHPLTLAISVDMLDTGIDVPEVVNLVFAKPVKSYVKFWQMIGRGTRLCANLFGPGQDKSAFRIFDHWGNFAWFEESYQEAEPKAAKSLLQRLFESRLQLAATALEQQDAAAFDMAVELLRQDIATLPENTIAVREKWREVRGVQRDGVLKAFAATTQSRLGNDIAPLMQWRDTRNLEDAYDLDLLIARLQGEGLRASATFHDLKDDLIDRVAQLPINLQAVRDKLVIIQKVKSGAFWEKPSTHDLETVRQELRGIMKFSVRPTRPGAGSRVIDLEEDASKIEFNRHTPRLEGMELAAYRQRVQQVLEELFAGNPTLARIRRNEPVSPADLDALVSLVLTQHPDVHLEWLTEFYPDTAGDLAAAIRTVVGLEAEVVARHFADFLAGHPQLTTKQQRFLALLQSHIAKYGAIAVDRLYEAPFTQVDSNGLDGVFEPAAIDELVAVIRHFQPSRAESHADQ